MGMPDKVMVYKDVSGEWRWRRISPNGEIVASSGEGYHNRVDCESQALQVNAQPFALVPAAPTDPDAWEGIEGPDEEPDTVAEEEIEHPEADAEWGHGDLEGKTGD